MFYCEIPADQFLFIQGEKAWFFFVLERGSLEVTVNNKFVRDLKNGEGFGELALLYNAPRSASVKAIDHSYLWGIDRETFRKSIDEIVIQEFDENRKLLENVFLFGIKLLSRMIYTSRINDKSAKRFNCHNFNNPKV